MKKLSLLIGIAFLAIVLSGCVTHKTYDKEIYNGTNLVSSLKTSSIKSDPLAHKIVVTKTKIAGAHFQLFSVPGTSYAPFDFTFGSETTVTETIPTATASNGIVSAPFAETDHGDDSMIQNTEDDNSTTLGAGLPTAAYVYPAVNVLNPLPSGIPTSSSAPATVSTNAAPVKAP